MRVALVISHPIQHFCPQYASFARYPGIEFKVFFGSALGYKPYLDENFKRVISWSNLQLQHFEHEFLNGEQVLKADKDLDAPELDEALEQFNPDVVIIYGYYQKIQRRAFRWAKRNKVITAYISDTEMRQHRSRIKELIKYPYLRYFFSNVDYVLTVGDANEEFYRYVGLKDNQFIRMNFPIDIQLYRKSFARKTMLAASIREKYAIPPGDFVASVVGKLVSWKNQGDIIDAMAVLEEKGVYMHLFIIGSGEMEEEWKQKAASLIRSKVHFTGFKATEDLPAYYAASDVYIHPASIEPHSLAISEAIYMGCPVIISDRCGSYGPTDDVREGRNGWVFPCSDINALADCIIHAINNAEEREAFAACSHAIGHEAQQRSHRGVLQRLEEKLYAPVKV